MSNNKQQALQFLEQDFKHDKLDKDKYYRIKDELLNMFRVKDLSPEAYKYIRKCYNQTFYKKLKEKEKVEE